MGHLAILCKSLPVFSCASVIARSSNCCMGTRTLERPLIWRLLRPGLSRCLSTSAICNSGHNRWSKIKHDKAKEDGIKSKERTLLSHEVYLASKYGGADTALNSRLALAITNAKRGQLSKASIDSAIMKGQGKSMSGMPLENLTIEAMLPFGVAAIVECSTDQKLRVLQDIRVIVNRNGGTVTPTAFLFDRKGKIWFEPKDGLGVDEAMDEAIEAGAEDIAMEEDQKLVVETSPTGVTEVAQKLQDRLRLQLHKTEILFVPKEDSLVPLNDEQGAELQKILDLFEEEPTLQNLYVNAVAES